MSNLRWIERDEPVPGEPLLMRKVKVLQYVVPGFRVTETLANGLRWKQTEQNDHWYDVPTVSS